MTVVFPDRRLMDNNILHAQYWDHGLVLIHTKDLDMDVQGKISKLRKFDKV